MKKTILILAVALSSNSVFAGNYNNDLSKAVKEKPGTTYSKVLDSKPAFSFGSSYIKETEVFNAQYNARGEMITASRHILSSNLPLRLAIELKKYSAGVWITDIVEVLDNKQTYYYVTMENADEKITLKSKKGKSWRVYNNK